MRTFVRFAAGMVTALVWASPANVSFTGNWVCVDHTLDNGSDYKVYYQFSQEGAVLKGRVIYPFAVMPITEGKAEANHFRIVHTLDPQHHFAVEGELVGNEIHLRASDWDGKFHAHTAKKAAPHEGDPPAYIKPPGLRTLPSNGLAKTPPMGWNSWNKFSEHIDGKTIREMADALVSSGMRDAGYVYLIVDGGWEGQRDANGVLQPNQKFPDIKSLVSYVHSKKLKFGLYSSPGPYECAGYQGSYGHEVQDAQTFADWGIDYFKYDLCSAGVIYKPNEIRAVYQKMGQALQATGRPIVYALCEYGNENVWEWGTKAGGNLWRISGDIQDNWESMSKIGFGLADLAAWAGPGHWNDADMLEIGNGGMTADEYRTHLSLWSLAAAPLLAGNDLRSMSEETKQILLNREVLAVDQDAAGQSGKPIQKSGLQEIWVKRLTGDAAAAGLFNRSATPVSMTIELNKLGFQAGIRARDLWNHKDLS
jgi:alpha-galactosidase